MRVSERFLRALIVLMIAFLGVVAEASAQSLLAWDTTGQVTKLLSSTQVPPGIAGPSVRVTGNTGPELTYVGTSPLPISPSSRYRLSAWVRVDSLGSAMPGPYLRCDLQDANRTVIGRAMSPGFDAARLGSWQQLVAEFMSPAGAVACRVTLDKGTAATNTIDVYLADSKLEIVSAAAWQAEVATWQASSGPNVHPRLFVNAAGFDALRSRATTTHAAIWRELKAIADTYVTQGPAAYQAPTATDDQQLWQRSTGNAMPTLAMAYKISGDPRYRDAARSFALAAISYPTWGAGRNRDVSLAASHLLYGLALTYDWLFADLDATTRVTIRDALLRHGDQLFQSHAFGMGMGNIPALTNVSWVIVSSFGVAGLALGPESPASLEWSQYALSYFQRVLRSLGPDGGSFEGVGYWGYSLEYLLKYLVLADSLLGKNLYANDWLQQTATYRLYLSMPLNAWSRDGSVVDIADSERLNWYGPEYLLRALAGRYRNASAQWLAQAIDDKNLANLASPWLNMVWYDPTVTSAAPASLPTLKHFADLGIVSARSGWTGDESLVVFKSGPFAGHHVMDSLGYDPGGFHAHPDANHFVVLGGGEWLLRDDGYGGKSTAQHNTLLVNGRGQVGEGGPGFDGGAAMSRRADARILKVSSTPALDVISADAAAAYPSELGLQKATRHLLYIKPDVLIVIDDVATSSSEPLELRFHPESSAAAQAGNAFLARGARTTLRLDPLTQAGVTVGYTEDAALDPQQGQAGRLHTVNLRMTGTAWQNAVALSWGTAPTQVYLTKTGSLWKFSLGNRIAEFHWNTGEACVYLAGQASSCDPGPIGPPGAPTLLQANP